MVDALDQYGVGMTSYAWDVDILFDRVCAATFTRIEYLVERRTCLVVQRIKDRKELNRISSYSPCCTPTIYSEALQLLLNPRKTNYCTLFIFEFIIYIVTRVGSVSRDKRLKKSTIQCWDILSNVLGAGSKTTKREKGADIKA